MWLSHSSYKYNFFVRFLGFLYYEPTNARSLSRIDKREDTRITEWWWWWWWAKFYCCCLLVYTIFFHALLYTPAFWRLILDMGWQWLSGPSGSVVLIQAMNEHWNSIQVWWMLQAIADSDGSDLFAYFYYFFYYFFQINLVSELECFAICVKLVNK